jgi:hypothetical protein
MDFSVAMPSLHRETQQKEEPDSFEQKAVYRSAQMIFRSIPLDSYFLIAKEPTRLPP